MGDTLDGDGGVELATTAQHQKWMEAFQRVFSIPDIQSSPARDDRVYAGCVRISISYRSTLPS